MEPLYPWFICPVFLQIHCPFGCSCPASVATLPGELHSSADLTPGTWELMLHPVQGSVEEPSFLSFSSEHLCSWKIDWAIGMKKLNVSLLRNPKPAGLSWIGLSGLILSPSKSKGREEWSSCKMFHPATSFQMNLLAPGSGKVPSPPVKGVIVTLPSLESVDWCFPTLALLSLGAGWFC